MPMHLRVDEERGYLIATLEGSVCYEEVRQVVETIYDEGGGHGLVLWDLRGGTVGSIAAEQVRELNEVSAARRAKFGHEPARSAVVAPRDVDFGLARMGQALSGMLNIEVRVFREIEDARAWLDLQVQQGRGEA